MTDGTERFLHVDRAVSPVVGVVLMVAVTVLLAGVVLAFAAGIQPAEPAPQASFALDAESGTATVTHVGGQTIQAENIRVQGVQCSFSGPVSAGSQCSGSVQDSTVRVLYEDGEQSYVLQEWSL